MNKTLNYFLVFLFLIKFGDVFGYNGYYQSIPPFGQQNHMKMEGQEMYRLDFLNKQQEDWFLKLEEQYNLELSFWQRRKNFAIVFIPREMKQTIFKKLEAKRIPYNLLSSDFKQLLNSMAKQSRTDL